MPSEWSQQNAGEVTRLRHSKQFLLQTFTALTRPNPVLSPMGVSDMAEKPSDYFNSLPFEERKRLSPVLNETRISTLKALRENEIRRHKATIRELDGWIANLATKDNPND